MRDRDAPFARASAPNVTLRLVDEIVERERSFPGSKRSAVFRVLGTGHTEEDTVLHLPDDGVVFCGDLLFVNGHPYLAHGDPDAWCSILETLAGLDARTFVPGHGPIVEAEDLHHLRAYIHDKRRGGSPPPLRSHFNRS